MSDILKRRSRYSGWNHSNMNKFEVRDLGLGICTEPRSAQRLIRKETLEKMWYINYILLPPSTSAVTSALDFRRKETITH